jgi:hypothetical protein
MSDKPDWTECLYRPSMLCGERLEHAADARGSEIWRMSQLYPPQPQPQPHGGHPEAPPAEAPIPTPAPEPAPTEMQIPIRHKGLIFSSYWVTVSDVYAGVGDVVVVKNVSNYVIIRQVPKSKIDREVVAKALQRRDDPYLKVALLLLSKK